MFADDGALHLDDDGVAGELLVQQIVQPVHTGDMAAAYRTHGDNLTIDEFDGRVFAEDTSISHPVVVIDGEAISRRRHYHNRFTSLLRSSVYDTASGIR